MKLITLIFTLLLTFSLTIYAQTTDTLEWTITSGGNNAGFFKKWQNADGSFTEWYQFNDRGRGDSTVANYRLDEQGFLVYLDAGGVDYYKKTVFEKFRIEDGIAYWENNSEKGEQQLEGMADYSPLSISAGTSYKAYLQTPDSSKLLLPTGKARISVLTTYQLPNGREIRLVSTAGFGMVPGYSWIDENDEYFAYPGSWFSIFPKGYEELNDELLAIQNTYKDRYFEEVTERITRKVDKGLIITGARLFDPQTGATRPDANILVENGKINRITFGTPEIPSGCEQLDASGKFVMPGLWDMHVHYSDQSLAMLYLANGTTNVRDMGNSLDLVDKKKAIDQGETIGPHIQVMAGFIDGAGEYAGPTGEIISSVEEGKVAITKYADHGYQQIKLYSSIKPEWVAPLVEEAKKYDLRVSGHIPAHMLASEAIEAGYDEIQHANMLFLNFYGKELDTRTPARFTTVAQQAAAFDFESEAFKTFVRQLKALDITVDPTVSVFEGMFTGKAGEPSPPLAVIIDRLPLNLQRYLKRGAGLPVPEGMAETYQQSFDNMLRMVKALYDAGITVVPGTDALGGFTLHRELENYVKAGIPPKEVLKMATVTAAEVAGQTGTYGRILEGKAADLIIIDGDPTEDISDIRRVEWVILDDNYYRTRDVLEAISIAYFE